MSPFYNLAFFWTELAYQGTSLRSWARDKKHHGFGMVCCSVHPPGAFSTEPPSR